MASVDIPFEGARFHDHWAIYEGDLWTSRDAEGFRISPGVSLIRTPGHTQEDITTLVETDSGLVAFTHMWWSADGPAEDPYAPAMARRSRRPTRPRGKPAQRLDRARGRRACATRDMTSSCGGTSSPTTCRK